MAVKEILVVLLTMGAGWSVSSIQEIFNSSEYSRMAEIRRQNQVELQEVIDRIAAERSMISQIHVVSESSTVQLSAGGKSE